MSDFISFSLYLPDVGRYLTLDDLDTFMGCCYVDSGSMKFMTEADARWAGMTYQNSFATLGLEVPSLHLRVHEAGSVTHVMVINY